MPACRGISNPLLRLFIEAAYARLKFPWASASKRNLPRSGRYHATTVFILHELDGLAFLFRRTSSVPCQRAQRRISGSISRNTILPTPLGSSLHRSMPPCLESRISFLVSGQDRAGFPTVAEVGVGLRFPTSCFVLANRQSTRRGRVETFEGRES